jgi:hypothetical protein
VELWQGFAIVTGIVLLSRQALVPEEKKATTAQFSRRLIKEKAEVRQRRGSVRQFPHRIFYRRIHSEEKLQMLRIRVVLVVLVVLTLTRHFSCVEEMSTL